MKKWKNNVIYVITAILVLSLLSACGNTKEAEETSDGLLKVNVAIQRIGAFANADYAKVEKYFEKNGLEVNLIEFKSGAEVIAAQQGGDVDIAAAGPGAAIWARDQGIKLELIANNELARDKGPDSSAIVVMNNSDIKSLKDLEGKKLGVFEPRSQLILSIKQLMTKNGVDPSKVEFITAPFPTLGGALSNNQVDAISVVDPFTTQVLTTSDTRVISWSSAEDIPGQPMGSWWVLDTYAAKNPKVIERFVKSMNEANKHLMANEKEAKDTIAKFTGLDREMLEEMPSIVWGTEVEMKPWDEVMDLYLKYGELENPPKSIKEYFSKEVLDSLE
jgi:NitT/TauT family transport system substrate-binding protein